MPLTRAEQAVAKLAEYISLKEVHKKQKRSELADLVSSRLVQIEKRERNLSSTPKSMPPAPTSSVMDKSPKADPGNES